MYVTNEYNSKYFINGKHGRLASANYLKPVIPITMSVTYYF